MTRAQAAITTLPAWPMIMLRSPKGWTGPKVVDGKPVEGTWRAHQVPVADLRRNRNTSRFLKTGCGATDRKNCSTRTANSIPELAELALRRRAPHGRESARQRRIAAARSGHAGFPRVRRRGAEARQPEAEATRVLGGFLRDVMKLNAESKNFRVFGPDETASNRLEALYRGN